jgi:hypothetical protein
MTRGSPRDGLASSVQQLLSIVRVFRTVERLI